MLKINNIRTKCMKVGSRYSLPVGLSSVTLKSYSSNTEMNDPNAKTRPWYILWKGRAIISPKKDKEPSPPSKKASTTSLKKKTLERQKSKKEETDKAENEDGKNSIKRKDTFRRRFSLRMRKTALKHSLSSATTSTATSSEYQSDDGGESDDYSDDDDDDDDEDTLVNSIKLSSQTLSLGGADDHFSDKDGSAHRLTELFINDINLIVDKTLALPNGPDKIKMIHSVLESIKPLYNMATLNLHFVILSSHVTEEPNSAQDASKVN
ncbi:uncharacterized protein [Lepeophtheirus salmonis]|uniref:uncharacterized protein isoform X2 n=1 Tax=Lepeophtheirus salmonis TaxID=72036 RepID=UPI001AE80BC7|nr:uncharacterized protein LOC121129763 isoform X2 [Lepeophtheirus salmonis]